MEKNLSSVQLLQKLMYFGKVLLEIRVWSSSTAEFCLQNTWHFREHFSELKL